MIKLFFLGSRAPGRTRTAALDHLARVHGRMVVAPPADAGEMPRGYTQHHVIDGAYPGSGAHAIERDLLTELWFDDMAHLAAATSTDYYRDRLAPDEPNFVDTASVAKMRVEPTVLRAGDADRFKAVFLLTPAAGTPAEALLDRLVPDLVAAGFGAITRNHVLAPPGATPFVADVIEATHDDRAVVLASVDRFAMRLSATGALDAARSLALATEVLTTEKLRG